MPQDIRHIDCHSALKQLWDYLDLELTDERMDEVRQHLAVCKQCLPHHDFARRFLDALHSTRDDAGMPSELRLQVMRQLTETGFTIQ